MALLIETSTSWGAGLVEGIAAYARQHAAWSLFWEPRGRYDLLRLPADWEARGVLARVTHQALADDILAAGIPAVDVSWYGYGEGRIPRCTSDECAAGGLAARYFLERGFRSFAYCGSPRRPKYVDRFGESFVRELAERGHACRVFSPDVSRYADLSWFAQVGALAEWLESLPKPVGVLAFDDAQGRQVTEACEYGGMHVPREVAVLGGEQDHLSSSLSRPPLSSIDQSPYDVGQQAAALLARLMQGAPAPGKPLLLPVHRIITRQSTDTLAVDDELLAAALRYIRDNCRARIRVQDVLKSVPVSRRALEKGFRRLLGRSPAEEIRRARVDLAVELLCTTGWSMPRIASESGFDRAELLTRAFRRELKTTPSRFRKAHQQQNAPRPESTDRPPRLP